ncbi:hypothetical protein F5B22DRAFT_654898 [Xylaria bambusicola]|uniref:uncharacterized protein n=1 Tax=Xylaria bambusicola TaxID=326684 RepID=UPI002008709D|nr:uncharacterized protein F5B22DRAFT_654898 [Xylaria bambusicola]KAI0517239.1 hypothetical protein F5B22DRAFT_654898 [Xylaria bambusicola]
MAPASELPLCVSVEGDAGYASCPCADGDEKYNVMSLEAASYRTGDEELVTLQQCDSDNVIVQCGLSHSYALGYCGINPYTTSKGYPRKDIATGVPLDNHLNGGASTEISSFLGANSTVDHKYNDLSKRNTTHPHKHKKKPLHHPPKSLYAEIIVPVLVVTFLIGVFFIFFARRKIRQQKKYQQQQQQRGNNQISSMEMGALRPLHDIQDDTKSAPTTRTTTTTTAMGILSRQGSGSSSTFTRPRPAPFPPPASPPPNRPLPPIPVRKVKSPPVVAEGHGGEGDIEMLPQWHLVYENTESSSGSKA